MMKLFLGLALFALAFAEYETEEGVIIGTNDNFDDIINNNDYVLVEFYAPWCGHCKQLAPHYAKAAQSLKEDESPALLVKVDATIHDKAAAKFEVQGYPTIKWFFKGEASDYNGGRTADDIISFITKKSGPPAAEITNKAGIDKLTSKHDVVVFGVFADRESEEAQAFISVAGGSDTTFAITSDAALAKEFGISSPGFAVLKTFDNGNSVYTGELNADDIRTFVSNEALPLVVEFSDANSAKIFGGDVKSHFLLFADASDESFASLKDTLSGVAGDFKGKLLFIYLDSAKPDNGRVMDYFGITAQEVPAIRIINIDDDMAKYKYESEVIDVDSLQEFCKSYVEGNLKRHLLTQEVPEDWDVNAVKIVTGKNYDAVVKDTTKNAFVMFHAPWCGHCKQLAPVWEKLGQKFEGVEDVVVAKIDATANELEDAAVESFPTLKFINKNNEILDYEGDRDLEALVKYVNEQVGASVEVSDEDKAEIESPEDASEPEDYDYDEDDYEGEDEEGSDDADASHDEL